MPLFTAIDIAATAIKHARYGSVILCIHTQRHVHGLPPFAVEHAGCFDKVRMEFFWICWAAADNKLRFNPGASDLTSWSSKGASTCFPGITLAG